MHRVTRSQLPLLGFILLWGATVSLSPALSGRVWAQAAPGAAAEPQVATDEEASEAAAEPAPSLGGMIIQSGWIGIPFYIFLGLLSVLATTVALERLLRLNARHIMPPELLDRLKEFIGRNELDPTRYRTICESWPSPTAAVLKAGVVRAGRSLLEIEKAMEDAIAKETSAMRSRHRPLTVVGSIAPLVGLLGTVVGMIFAFYQSSQAGLGKAEVLAEYIYLALITTALGLTVAIPSLLLAAWFNARVERYMRGIDDCLIDMLPIFAAMEGATQSRQQTVSANVTSRPATMGPLTTSAAEA